MELGDILDAFDDHLEAEFAREADHRLDHDPVAAAADDIGDHRPVDLDRIERQRGQIGEARIAGAEIVDRDADARGAQPGEPAATSRLSAIRLLSTISAVIWSGLRPARGDFGQQPLLIARHDRDRAAGG